MTIVFPLLVDENVSPNIIPGVCKALEKFCLHYKVEEILKMGGLSSDTVLSNIVSAGFEMGTGGTNAFFKKLFENESVSETHTPQKQAEKRVQGKVKDTTQEEEKAIDHIEKQAGKGADHELKEKEFELKKREFEEKQHRIEDRKLELNTLNLRANLSIEPTTCLATSRKGSQVIGIKVIPYPVSSRPFIRQLLQDNSLSIMDRFLARYERGVTRAFYAIMRKVPFFRNIPIEKDPFKDIIYARSKFGKNIFLMLSLSSLESDDMFKSQGGVDRLNRLGWNSVIIADDVTKRIIFCMKEYGGMCEPTHYNFLYSAMGKEGQEAYERLEDLKKSTSPLWSQHMRMKPSRMFGESLANDLKETYISVGLPCLKGDCK